MKKKFEGALATPISPPRPGLLMSDSELKKLPEEWGEEDSKKLILLCQHYDIRQNPNMFYKLALALAREFVGGFKECTPKGRHAKWTNLNRGALVVEIERQIESGPGDKNHGARWAATILARREPWKSFIESKDSQVTSADPAEAIRKAYFNFKDTPWTKVMRKAFKMYQHEKTISEWDELVVDVVKNLHPEESIPA